MKSRSLLFILVLLLSWVASSGRTVLSCGESRGWLDNLSLVYDGATLCRVNSNITDETGRQFYGRTGWANGTYMKSAVLEFNAAGHLTKDSGRMLQSVAYNTMGHPVSYCQGTVPTAGTPRQERAYDATGYKLRQTDYGPVHGVFGKTADRRYLDLYTFNADTLERIDFAGGYFDGCGKAHFIFTDWQGNVTITTDADGRLEQHIGYYPYGEPWREPSGQHATLFAGKERVGGLPQGDYDFGPRGYRSTLLLWDSPDSENTAYPWWSPWMYCGANPIANIDPTGNDITILGLNESAVVIDTNLINTELDLSRLGLDWGGKYNLHGDDVLSAGLDIVGIFDPTGVADGLNAYIQAKNGHWGGAFISTISIVPGGDVAKAGKIGKDLEIIQTAVNSTKSAKIISAQRRKAVRNAWKEERQLIRDSEGTRFWSNAEREELLRTGKVKGYEGHHINNVKDHPELADNPDNVIFLTRREHLEAHSGNFRNETHGKLVNRNPNRH